MLLDRRKIASAALSTVAGILLLVSGTPGPIGFYQFILEELPAFISSEPLLSIARTAILVLIGLSLLGGLVVILGGYLIFKGHGTAGKLAIGLGAGVGIPWLIFMLFAFATTQDASSFLAQHSVVGWIGIVIAFAARVAAK